MWQIKVTSNPDGRHPEVEFYNSNSKEEAFEKYIYLLSIRATHEEVSAPYPVRM